MRDIPYKYRNTFVLEEIFLANLRSDKTRKFKSKMSIYASESKLWQNGAKFGLIENVYHSLSMI